ncbi:1-acyl-sn-glycerol-3-phosphate acyltransferase [Fulvivirgaceae bacterium BMA10]|uniref:Glycerol-3-phosphate acyltransferase n=1 Tax=Splendidivirga corallicola TaxID=3051826 RepID=A0ABT8KIF3_9BACT|nr:1-acyl-sn-glycerol-3-phosphate acyltransferase [Fulvivirgaceae bacterium BMA10]
MQPSGTKKDRKIYEPILPGPKEWPVVQLSKHRKQFIQEVIDETVKKINSLASDKSSLVEEIEQTLYKEKLRIKQNPWDIDPEDEPLFWARVKSKLVQISQNSNGEGAELVGTVLNDITQRYANEIAGNFKQSRYKIARSVATFGFSRLLNASRVKGFSSLWSNQLTLQDKIHLTGEAEHLRKLAKIGTVVMVPTHFSNLDSILIGWVIQALGLPPFIYGAGLNLFNIELFSYFMDSLGAYKVDRRKKNLIYLETLKTYSTLAIQKGCHSLFFPGGTRSRSGKIETKLKLGLLGTALEAQRLNFEENPESTNKIFIVPVVLNYHFVLEAPSLINDYLKSKGQERYYVESDQYSNSYKIFAFLLKFFTKGSDISVSIGRGLDLFGNYVDDEGNSLDKHNRTIDTKDYFISNGKVTYDRQRDSEYTKMLGAVIVREFHRINRVFSSHLVAFTAFSVLRAKYDNLDLYSLLRLPEEDLIIPYKEFREKFDLLRKEVFKLHKKGKVNIAPHLEGDLEDVIDHGLSNVGMYHSKRPLLKNKEGDIITKDLNTLFYYHNRMDGYGLKKYF